MQFITIATTGNTQDFGGLTGSLWSHRSFQYPTRGIFAGGYNPSNQVQNKIDFVTIATLGNATDFGDLFLARRSAGGTSNSNSTLRRIFTGNKQYD